MVNIPNLTIDTCYKACEAPSPDWHCGICLTSLVSLTSLEQDSATEHSTVVKTKVCDHYFHQACIDTWFRSATPNLNVCPLDRLVLYGTARVPQTPVNVPDYAPFLGHNVDEHDSQHELPSTISRPGSSYSANNGHGITFGAMNLGHDFLSPSLTDFFGAEDAAQPLQGTVNVRPESSQQPQPNDSPSLPNGFRTMPDHPENSREPRRWGW